MTRKSLDELGTLQKAVMETVWASGEASVQRVLDKLGRKNKPAYTTILSAMQKLERLGWLRHRVEGRTYVYGPAFSREEEGRKALRKFMDRVFGSDPLLLVQHLLDDEDMGTEDLTALRKMIDQRRKELSDG
ncbi:MAG: BlaI/MecI/CopY family transcriptional regulator [Planctomycetes bacterium]|nr:BlaI/MecI/CopY family transcriptional regulator [Planctomycetota bacterium]MBL7043607.1 BlaI/MecI/CopY family transcriptional regulator [Pirellulaceae bacterium]